MAGGQEEEDTLALGLRSLCSVPALGHSWPLDMNGGLPSPTDAASRDKVDPGAHLRVPLYAQARKSPGTPGRSSKMSNTRRGMYCGGPGSLSRSQHRGDRGFCLPCPAHSPEHRTGQTGFPQDTECVFVD